jgi:competence protein ComEC
VAVISAGFENRFHNPHPDVIARLDASGVRVLRTDLWGLVSVKSDGRRLKIGSFRWRLTD